MRLALLTLSAACTSTPVSEPPSYEAWIYSNPDGPKFDNVALDGEGDFAFVGGWYAGANLFTLQPEADSSPLWSKPADGAYGVVATNVAFYGLWQSEDPADTRVESFAFGEKEAGAQLVPVGIELSPGRNRQHIGSSTLIAAAHERIDLGGGNARLDPRLLISDRGLSSPRVFSDPSVAGPITALSLLDDETSALLASGATLYRLALDKQPTEITSSADLGANTSCFEASANGDRVYSAFDRLVVLRWSGQRYDPTRLAPPNQSVVCGAITLSPNEDVVAVAWAVISGGAPNEILQTLLELRDAETGAVLASHLGNKGEGQYQDTPVAVEFSRDGRLLAVASWGTEVGGDNNVRIFELRNGLAEYDAFDLDGSPFDLAWTDDSGLLVVVGKGVHANETGRGSIAIGQPITPLDD